MESMTFDDLQPNRQEKLKRLVETVTPTNYNELGGKRLLTWDRDLIVFSLGSDIRAVFTEKHGRMDLGAVLKHTDYDQMANGGQVAFINRIKNGLTPFAEATQKRFLRSVATTTVNPEDVAAAEDKRIAQEDLVAMKPVAQIVREWMNNRSLGSQFTSQDIANNRPGVSREAISACLWHYRKLGHIEDTGSTLGTTAAPLNVFRLVSQPPEEQESTGGVRGKILAWLKQQPVGSTVVVYKMAEQIGLNEREAKSVGSFIADLKPHGLLPVVGHEKTPHGRRSEKLQITNALMDYFPGVPGKKHAERPATGASPEAPAGERTPRRILSDIQRELQELYETMMAKIEAAREATAEKVKKLTDYTEDELLEAMMKVRKKARTGNEQRAGAH